MTPAVTTEVIPATDVRPGDTVLLPTTVIDGSAYDWSGPFTVRRVELLHDITGAPFVVLTHDETTFGMGVWLVLAPWLRDSNARGTVRRVAPAVAE